MAWEEKRVGEYGSGLYAWAGRGGNKMCVYLLKKKKTCRRVVNPASDTDGKRKVRK